MKRVVFLASSAAVLTQFTTYDRIALQTLGCEIHMACNLSDPELSPEALQAFQEQNPRLIWHDIPLQPSIHKKRNNREACAQLESLLRELQPALLHCRGTIAGIYGRQAAAALQIPVFYTAHDFRVYHGCRLSDRLYYAPAERKGARTTDRFFAVCAEDAAYAEKRLKCPAVTALPDVIPYETYATPARSAAQVRQELGVPEDATLLISVGALRPQKRLRVVLQAMTRLRQGDSLHYVICGAGREEAFLRKLTENLHLEQQVHLLGYRTDIPDLLGAADLFCLPARGEGCGRSAIEAMAAGLPLLLVRSHGTKSYAEPGEGAVCLKGDLVQSCADGIVTLQENKLLRRQMGAHNRAAAKAFSDTGRMKQLREYYREILEDKNKP